MFNYKVEDILLSKKLTKVINEDFYIFEADNFLPLDFYLALEKSFPEKSFLESEKRFYDRFVLKFDARYKPDESIILNKRANDFFKKSPEWAYFISLLTDNKFVYDVLDLLDKPISDHKGFKYSFRKNKYMKFKKRIGNGIQNNACIFTITSFISMELNA